MSRASNLAGFSTSISPPRDLSVGVITATSFVGNVTGTATGLSGTPNIDVGSLNVTNIDAVGVITATSFVGDITGDVTGGTLVGTALSVSGISTLGDLRLASIADKISIQSGTGVTLTYNTGGGNVVYMTSASGPITLNVNGIPTDSSFDSRAISFAVIVQQGATAYACTSVNLNGVNFDASYTVGTSTHIAYAGGTVAAGSTSGFDVFNFTGINTTGSASTTTNYKLLGNVNGDYRGY